MITEWQNDQLSQLGNAYPNHAMRKFCRQAPGWYADAQLIANDLGLDRVIPLRILDIGCGFGYFCSVGLALGHYVTGLDLHDSMVRQGAAILNVQYVGHEIRRYKPLPSLLTGYDLITMFGVNLRGPSGNYWSHHQYAFLALDLCDRLKSGGRWMLRPNVRDFDTHDLSKRFIFDVLAWADAIDHFAEVQIDDRQIVVTKRKEDEG